MQCPNCQTMNPPAAKFCVECGKAFDIDCPKCGSVTPANGKFCMSCGHNLQRIPASESIDYSEPQTYTPKFLADKILTSRSSIEGERKLVTVFLPMWPISPPCRKNWTPKMLTILWTGLSRS